jgi:hypothetical protein
VHSVVNQQSGFALETVGNNNSPTFQIYLQCQLFLSGDASNLGQRQTHLSNQWLVQVQLALMGDVAEYGLILPRNMQAADGHRKQRGLECLGHRNGDRHATIRHGHNERLLILKLG